MREQGMSDYPDSESRRNFLRGAMAFGITAAADSVVHADSTKKEVLHRVEVENLLEELRAKFVDEDAYADCPAYRAKVADLSKRLGVEHDQKRFDPYKNKLAAIYQKLRVAAPDLPPDLVLHFFEESEQAVRTTGRTKSFFSSVGPHVFVDAHVLKFLNDKQLAAVLGHEASHAKLKHYFIGTEISARYEAGTITKDVRDAALLQLEFDADAEDINILSVAAQNEPTHTVSFKPDDLVGALYVFRAKGGIVGEVDQRTKAIKSLKGQLLAKK